ncbi:MAG: uncharacterized protein KVP18_000737 [Porospora cf. gigantea A]|uniref:uncharacterized protein n=1 Tax=Porospora cf. gigantea A TaxID=2853593 RepID=UPI00355A73AA|nr:MAG: hypothetical protein KVP18_000737 [Porospora cf. gigantea A]
MLRIRRPSRRVHYGSETPIARFKEVGRLRTHDRSLVSLMSDALSRRSSLPSSLSISVGGDLPSKRLPPTSQWASPIFTRMVLQDSATAHLYSLPQSPLPWNGPFAVQSFETPFFRGKILLRGRGLPMEDHAANYFGNRRRVQQVVFQGRFKKKFFLDELWGGQIFDKPWAKISRHVLVPGMKAAKLLNPSMLCDLAAARPYFLFPLLGSQQRVNVAMPGQEPDITGDIHEDCTLLSSDFDMDETEHVRVAWRKKHLTRVANCSKYQVNTSHVYTLEHYQDLLHFDMFDYRIPVVNWSVKLSEYLRDMPLEISALHFVPSEHDSIADAFTKAMGSVEYLWRVQIWHRDCV